MTCSAVMVWKDLKAMSVSEKWKPKMLIPYELTDVNRDNYLEMLVYAF